MWEDLRLKEGPEWVAECLRNNSLVCVTDGSYTKSRAKNVCSAGWIMACRRTGKCISGTMVEKSQSAGSYRGEIPGILSIRLFLLAVEEYCGAVTRDNKICCDNKGALVTFEKKSKRVPKGKAHTDIQRVLRTVTARTRSTFLSQHVKAHQDDVKKWRDMTFEERLNSKCDMMAKGAIREYLARETERYVESTLNKVTYAPDPYDKYRLPLEAACVFVEGVKQTTDVGKDLKHVIGRQEARKFYAAKFDEGKGLMPPEAFDSVEWDALKMTLSCKPKMYNVWYSKQCSGWCGVNSKLVDWGYSTDSRCPNCNCLGEDAGHLMICKHEGRSAMFEEHVKKIEEWMEDHYTDPQLAELVVFYLRGRGRQKLTHLSRGYRGEYQAMARAQDRIGWRHFTEGKLAKNFRAIQRGYLIQEDTQLTVDSWLKGLVTKLLEMTHAQWIFRCISKHHRTKGSLVLKANEDLLKEIDRQLDMGVDCICLLYTSPSPRD